MLCVGCSGLSKQHLRFAGIAAPTACVLCAVRLKGIP